MRPVVCRVAPSPTGRCHLGTARTALYSFLAAKKAGGTFIIRMEDTDAARSTKEFEKDILDSLEWLGIKSDVPIVRQSERSAIYKEYVETLLKKGLAYKCYCTAAELDKKRQAQIDNKETPLYDRACHGKPDQPGKPYVVRFKVEDHGGVQWRDLVFGRQNVRKAQISDFIIQRQDGSVGYLLANMLDDALQGVTHIVRGVDGLANAPAQIMLFEALGFPVPTYAHTPFILNDKGEKLSKRNGDASLMQYKDAGMLPEAMVNALVRIGWSHGNDEIFSMGDLIQYFDLNHVSKSPGNLDPKKFEHINRHWIKVGDPDHIAELLEPFMDKEWLLGMGNEKAQAKVLMKLSCAAAVKTLQTRSTSLVDMAQKIRFYYDPNFVPERAITDKEKLFLTCALSFLDKCDYTEAALEAALASAQETCEIGMKELGPALRMALAGRSSSPSNVEMMAVLGKEEVHNRVKKAILG